MSKKRPSVGQTIGGVMVGIEQQIFRTTPPANELIAKGTPLRPVAAADGGTLMISMPGDRDSGDAPPELLHLSAPGVEAVIDLGAGGRLASFVVDGRELLVTAGDGPFAWGSFPMVPFAGRVRDGRFEFRGRRYELPANLPPHAIHGTVLDRRWALVDDHTVETELGPPWPFRGRARQCFQLEAGRFTSRLELQADEPMPASIGWHPWFRRQPVPVGRVLAPASHAGPLEIELEAGAMFRRDPAGIATGERIAPPPGPWDDCFTDLRRPPVLRWPHFLELKIESDCPAWVVYTVPDHALCVEPQTAPPDALNTGTAAVVIPGRPLTAEMTWTWRSLAG